MSNSTLSLIGNFLSLQCGPIVDDEYEEDFDSMIRDISIKCISALVETPAAIIKSDVVTETYAEALGIRMNFAKQGVERRCATSDDLGFNDGMSIEHDIRGGLSTMPRSKRSLCFSLLRCAVTGISKIMKLTAPFQGAKIQPQQSSIISIVQNHCVQFSEFTARCIHGESDPRCLLQLLELLNSTQVNFRDWFQVARTISPNKVFPNEDYFDAVAPYYPIQFTPPPNNIHGITREGLHSALISVLAFTGMDEGARRYRKPTMLGCSFNLFLEQLLPGQTGEESPSTLEKLECLECISKLMFPTSEAGQPMLESECTNLSFEEIRNLSTALITIHDEASMGVTSESGDLRDQNKILAENCRNLASRTAIQLEKDSKNGTEGLWDRFVSEPLEREMKKLQLTPAYAKTSIAYEACLAASGGTRTLRTCLMKGLRPLLEYVRKHSNDASDNSLAAIHGIAAFCSSCQVTLSKSRLELGVELTPHPLEAYTKDICNLLLEIVECEIPSSSSVLKAAASSCLECLFLSSVDKHLEAEELRKRICNFLKALLGNIKISVEDEPTNDNDEVAQYRSVSSNVLGRIVGASLSEFGDDSRDEDENSKDPKSRSILLAPTIQYFVRTEIFPELMAASFVGTNGYSEDRFDRIALSTACSSNPSLASSVIKAHLESLLEALEDNIGSENSQTSLEALSDVLRRGAGDNAIRAFHEIDLVDNIIDVLCYNLAGVASSGLRDSISQVALHATVGNKKETMESKITAVNAIVNGLLPAYSRMVPRKRLKKLLKTISDKIPPLSEADEGILIVRLPILSAALQAAEAAILEEVVNEIENDDGIPVTELLEGLTEYVLSKEHLTSVRNAGALCVYALLKSGFNRNLDCPTKPLLNDINDRVLYASNDLGMMRNCLNYLSLLSSASALRGASSLSTADAIARFLTGLACEGCAQLPINHDGEHKKVDFSILFEQEYVQTALGIAAASSYGAIILEERLKPLMRQRLTYGCIKYIKKLSGKQDEKPQSTGLRQIGSLIVVCHIVCACNLSKFDQAILRSFATTLIRGFSSDLFKGSSLLVTKFPDETAKARTLVVSTLLKLLCTTPKVANGLVLEIVSGLLRAYAVTDPTTEVGCKLITLQSLGVLTHLDGAKDSVLAVKPAVIAILASAMSQKNILLRSAAVDVRNTWCLVG